MALTSAFLVYVVVFLLCFPVWLLMSEMWSYLSPWYSGGNTILTGSVQGSNVITALGNTTFYYIPDSALTLLYFGLIVAVFLGALYEAANPETLPIGLLFLIPLILVTMPLSDFTHWLYNQPGFANVAGYYTSSEYISDWSPLFTTLFTIGYLIFVITKKQTYGTLPSGPNIIGG